MTVRRLNHRKERGLREAGILPLNYSALKWRLKYSKFSRLRDEPSGDSLGI